MWFALLPPTCGQWALTKYQIASTRFGCHADGPCWTKPAGLFVLGFGKPAGTWMVRSSWILPAGAFRFLLATIVLANHSSRIYLGSMAVFIFFVLSGFWITRMWREKYSRLKPAY